MLPNPNALDLGRFSIDPRLNFEYHPVDPHHQNIRTHR